MLRSRSSRYSVGNPLFQSRRHLGQPFDRIQRMAERGRGRPPGRNSRMQRCLDACRERLVDLRAGKCAGRVPANSRGRQSGGAQEVKCHFHDAALVNQGWRLAAALCIRLAFVQTALADHDPVRDADQFPCRRTSRRGARRGRRGSRIDAERQFGVEPVGGRLDGFGLVVTPWARCRRRRAMAAGQDDALASWPCSMAAPTMRETPMP